MPARIWFVDVAFLVRTLDDNRNHRVKAARGPEPVGTPLKDATWAFMSTNTDWILPAFDAASRRQQFACRKVYQTMSQGIRHPLGSGHHQTSTPQAVAFDQDMLNNGPS